ncbi:16S rRNA processing protein RimM [Corynebacterium frankenforstense DSM 45800]|uniref:Ribosome maturation factor RimM n=1 Tax=Corynebacterium frankenforstense DSM 45800 TaxID=1437875 RepID=A0A1L7CTP0_9CORY|nr:ribosome maturation factor RimM [Corynebacterium frankenforstense]APT89138.1 16S rRNA processing protein RimM [Corynebacterium frankenforstense DSM 45800]
MELRIGRVVKTHGIRGEVVVDPTTDAPEERFAVGGHLVGRQHGRTHELTVVGVRPHKGRLLVSFEEIADRTAAESLRGTQFFAAPREDPDDDGYYDHQLEGLAVLRDGERVGTVTGVTHAPAQNLLEIELAAGGEALVPFVADIVPEVDLDAGTLTVDPPEGLLDL